MVRRPFGREPGLVSALRRRKLKQLSACGWPLPFSRYRRSTGKRMPPVSTSESLDF